MKKDKDKRNKKQSSEQNKQNKVYKNKKNILRYQDIDEEEFEEYL